MTHDSKVAFKRKQNLQYFEAETERQCIVRALLRQVFIFISSFIQLLKTCLFCVSETKAKFYGNSTQHLNFFFWHF